MRTILQNISRWLLFNSRYLGKPLWDSGVSPPELLAFIQESTPGRALDLGCGTGTNLLTLARAGWQVVGVEYALIAVLKARRKLAGFGKSARVHAGSVTELGFLRKPFNLILDIGCYHSLGVGERERYRANVGWLLAPGGTFLLYAHMQAENRLSGIQEQDIQAFARGLRLVSRQEGVDHGGRASVWLRFERGD